MKKIFLFLLIFLCFFNSMAFAKKHGKSHKYKFKVSKPEKEPTGFAATQKWLEDAHLSCSKDSLMSDMVHLGAGYDVVKDPKFNMSVGTTNVLHLDITFK